MKKIYFSLITSLFAFAIKGQTITVSNHTPVNNDIFSFYQCDSAGVTPGANGTSVNWNYSSIATRSSIVTTNTVSTGTFTDYPQAGIRIGTNSGGLTYLKGTASELTYWGGNLSIANIASNITYTTAAVKMPYPTSYGSGTMNPVGGTYTINVLGGIANTFTGVSTTTCNGTGTLSLPGGMTYSNVIRVNNTQTLILNVLTSTGSIVQSVDDFYSLSDSKYPIFSISSSTAALPSPIGNSTLSIVTRFKNVGTGLNEQERITSFIQVYPNPANSHLNFVSENAIGKVQIYDVIGKLILSQDLINGKAFMDVSDLNSGIYVYKITDNNRTIKSGRITVAH